jgi:hypothetical protein
MVVKLAESVRSGAMRCDAVRYAAVGCARGRTYGKLPASLISLPPLFHRVLACTDRLWTWRLSDCRHIYFSLVRESSEGHRAPVQCRRLARRRLADKANEWIAWHRRAHWRTSNSIGFCPSQRMHADGRQIPTAPVLIDKLAIVGKMRHSTIYSHHSVALRHVAMLVYSLEYIEHLVRT